MTDPTPQDINDQIKNTRQIGGIGNFYGCLVVAEYNGKYYWSIPNYDGCDFEEIPKSLYDELNRFEDS